MRSQSSTSCWNCRHDGAAGHRFLGEQIGGAHQHADTGPRAADERRRHRRHHRGGHGVVDAAREEQLRRSAASAAPAREQRVDHRAPQHEAVQRADVSAALAALEDEAPRTFRGTAGAGGAGTCRKVAMPARLEVRGLVGTSAGDDREGGAQIARPPPVARPSSSCGAKPSRPMPQGASPRRSRVEASSASTSGPRSSASARIGKAPPAATAEQTPPCRTRASSVPGRSDSGCPGRPRAARLRPGANGPPRAGRVMSRPPGSR